MPSPGSVRESGQYSCRLGFRRSFGRLESLGPQMYIYEIAISAEMPMASPMSSEMWMEDILRGLSSHIISTLGRLGYRRHGMDRDDLLQEVYIRIWTAIRDDNYDIRYLNAYIQKIVYSVFINEIRRIDRERETLNSCEERSQPASGDNNGYAAGDEMIKEALIDSIDLLTKSRQTVMRLRLEGYTLNEIAELNRWSYRKTCSVFYRGLKELKNRLQEKGFNYEDEPCRPF